MPVSDAQFDQAMIELRDRNDHKDHRRRHITGPMICGIAAVIVVAVIAVAVIIGKPKTTTYTYAAYDVAAQYGMKLDETFPLSIQGVPNNYGPISTHLFLGNEKPSKSPGLDQNLRLAIELNGVTKGANLDRNRDIIWIQSDQATTVSIRFTPRTDVPITCSWDHNNSPAKGETAKQTCFETSSLAYQLDDPRASNVGQFLATYFTITVTLPPAAYQVAFTR